MEIFRCFAIAQHDNPLYDWVGAEVLALAGFTMLAHPDFIKLVHGLFYDFWVIGQDARLEVAFVADFHSDTCTCEVGTAHIDHLTIED